MRVQEDGGKEEGVENDRKTGQNGLEWGRVRGSVGKREETEMVDNYSPAWECYLVPQPPSSSNTRLSLQIIIYI